MADYIERPPMRIVSADEMFPQPTEQVDQNKMHWSEYHPMYHEGE